ncbi:hypothetical protein [Streptomyces qinglanensis]
MNTSQHVKLRLGFFEGFETVTGLLRDTGAHPPHRISLLRPRS